jgi:transglutaminase-like putative cysteine protease
MSTQLRPRTEGEPGARGSGAGRVELDSDAHRTLLALAACALACVPLCSLFTDQLWLGSAWLTMAVVVGPAAVLRVRGPARVWHTWLGLGLGVCWLTARFAHQHAVGGVLPTTRTWDDAGELFHQLGQLTSTSQAPIQPTAPATFVLCIVLGLFAALVDLLAVIGGRAALAGIPMLVIYVVAGAIVRQSVHWLLFIVAASGFLLLLALNARDEFGRWGPLIPRQGESHGGISLAVSGQRIGVIAVVAAVLLAAIVPKRAGNPFADVFGTGGVGGGTLGLGGSSAIDPFATLKGQLIEPRATPMLRVHLEGPAAVQPFYLRTVVLSKFDDKGWSRGDDGASEAMVDGEYSFTPNTDTSQLPAETFTADIQVLGLRGDPGIFSRPVSINGLGGGARWLPDKEVVATEVKQGDSYTEVVAQPNPSPSYLTAVDSTPTDANLPTSQGVPAYVASLVVNLTTGTSTQYARARAISDFFTNPANHFVYSLQTKAGDSGSDLVDFLHNRTGFCQQYAAAMAIMLRVAGVPSRVVLGYTHDPARNGSFLVNSTDAHAWVEAFLPGAGWIPFDPTPITDGVGGATTSLAWGPHVATGGAGGSARAGRGVPTSNKTAGVNLDVGTNTPQPGSAISRSAPSPWPGRIGMGAVIVVAVALLLAAVLPVTVRRWRRWRRLSAARDGDTDALWQELSATAEDLGYVWSSARTPRQVANWLGRTGSGGTALRELADAVESARYAPHRDGAPSANGRNAQLVADLRLVETQLRGGRRWLVRWRARLWPQSLGWPVKVTTRSSARH